MEQTVTPSYEFLSINLNERKQYTSLIFRMTTDLRLSVEIFHKNSLIVIIFRETVGMLVKHQ